MKAYKVVRRSGATAEAPDESVRIWDGENLLWERTADSYVEVDGKPYDKLEKKFAFREGNPSSLAALDHPAGAASRSGDY